MDEETQRLESASDWLICLQKDDLAVEEIVSGKMNLKPLMSHRYRMQEANEAFAMARDRSQSMKVHLEFD